MFTLAYVHYELHTKFGNNFQKMLRYYTTNWFNRFNIYTKNWFNTFG